jgi:Mg2+ and Co2+ transporter CorA
MRPRLSFVGSVTTVRFAIATDGDLTINITSRQAPAFVDVRSALTAGEVCQLADWVTYAPTTDNY